MNTMITFSQEEMLARVEGCQLRMERSGLTGIMVSAEANINYYSGYRTHAPWTTFTRPMFLFLPLQGRPLLLTQTFVTPEAQARSIGCDHPQF